MRIDTREMVQWDLTLTIGGRAYVVREPTLGDAAELPSPDNASVDAFAAVIDPMIEGDIKPDWSSMPIGDAIAAFTAIEAYLREYLTKKREAARIAARRAFEPAAT